MICVVHRMIATSQADYPVALRIGQIGLGLNYEWSPYNPVRLHDPRWIIWWGHDLTVCQIAKQLMFTISSGGGFERPCGSFDDAQRWLYVEWTRYYMVTLWSGKIFLCPTDHLVRPCLDYVSGGQVTGLVTLWHLMDHLVNHIPFL